MWSPTHTVGDHGTYSRISRITIQSQVLALTSVAVEDASWPGNTCLSVVRELANPQTRLCAQAPTLILETDPRRRSEPRLGRSSHCLHRTMGRIFARRQSQLAVMRQQGALPCVRGLFTLSSFTTDRRFHTLYKLPTHDFCASHTITHLTCITQSGGAAQPGSKIAWTASNRPDTPPVSSA